MCRLLIHGVYDSTTIQTLKNLGIKSFSFDLRGKSYNLVRLRDLQTSIQQLKNEDIFLTFDDDKKETIMAFLDILKSDSAKIKIIFRSNQTSQYFEEIGQDFYWMFHPDLDWKSILSLKNAKGVILPICFQKFYQQYLGFWKLVEEKHLDVFVHADNFEQCLEMNLSSEVKMSIDLTNEVEKSYRVVDQDKLKKMKIWSKLNENSSGQ
jgi:hypothetical protein